MASDPLGLQDSPLFGGLAKAFAGLDSLKAKMGGRRTSTAGTREAMPDYAGMGARQQAGTQPKAPKVKPTAKGAAPVKKVSKKSAKKVAPKKAAAKGMKPNPFAKGKTEAPGMKSKGKAADKMVTMKKAVNMKKKA